MKKVKLDLNMLLGAIIVFLSIGFIVFVTSYRFPIGDDCRGQTTYGILLYLDDYNDITDIGPKIHNLSTWLMSIKLHMQNWGGRLMPVSFCGFLALFGQKFTGLLTGFFIFTVIFEIMYLALGKHKSMTRFLKEDFFQNGYIVCGLFAALVYKNVFVDYMFMWTMTCHYVLPTFLCLTYFCIATNLFWEKEKYIISKRNVLFVNILGFAAGASNEAISATFLVVFGVYFFLHIRNMKLKTPYMLAVNLGFFIGLFLSVFSTGNQVRMKQSHDVLKYSRSYFEKLFDSLACHLSVSIYGFSPKVGVIIWMIVIIVGGCIWSSNKDNIKKSLIEILPFICGTIGSILIWGMASYTPRYGMFAFLSIVFLCLLFLYKDVFLRINMSKHMLRWINGLACIILIIIVIKNSDWMKDLYETRIVWDYAIEQADSCEIVNVPKYPESCNNIYTMNNWINDGEKLKALEYIEIYDCILNPQ